jgi:hypothetical protein
MTEDTKKRTFLVLLLALAGGGLAISYYQNPAATKYREPKSLENLQADFLKLMQREHPQFNEMSVTRLLARGKEGDTIVVAHTFFNEHEFAYGSSYNAVRKWVEENCADLIRANVWRVGVMREGSHVEPIASVPVSCPK